MSTATQFDLVIVGSGPAGQKAAIQGAKSGMKVAVIEKGRQLGGCCVYSGTIPSKTLRETIVALSSFRQRSGNAIPVSIPEGLKVASLLSRLHQVLKGHEQYITDQLVRNGIVCLHGKARFIGPHQVEIRGVKGDISTVKGRYIMIAAGSHPRTPPNVPVDHEHILDSDSFLSLTYLPASLVVLGAGVIASEYASMFAQLGVKVTMIDKRSLPLSFLDDELTTRFVEEFEATGSKFMGDTDIDRVEWNGMEVITKLGNGTELRSEKLLCALGRMAPVKELNLQAAGIEVSPRGVIPVDAHCQTAQTHIYAIGDVAGPPGLAASAMEQGRRAVCHALGLKVQTLPENIPVGIYSVPEMSQVGLAEKEALERYGSVTIGRARFNELGRGHIANITSGLLKMVADGEGQRVLGVQIIGEGATELIHLGQMAIINRANVDTFIENIFNFPTLAEGYRVAALDIAEQVANKKVAAVATD